jgi:hypothetical protein
MSAFILCLCCPGLLAPLQWANRPTKESYKLSVRSIISQNFEPKQTIKPNLLGWKTVRTTLCSINTSKFAQYTQHRNFEVSKDKFSKYCPLIKVCGRQTPMPLGCQSRFFCQLTARVKRSLLMNDVNPTSVATAGVKMYHMWSTQLQCW